MKIITQLISVSYLINNSSDLNDKMLIHDKDFDGLLSQEEAMNAIHEIKTEHTEFIPKIEKHFKEMVQRQGKKKLTPKEVIDEYMKAFSKVIDGDRPERKVKMDKYSRYSRDDMMYDHMPEEEKEELLDPYYDQDSGDDDMMDQDL